LSPDIVCGAELTVQSQRCRTMVHACWKSWVSCIEIWYGYRRRIITNNAALSFSS